MVQYSPCIENWQIIQRDLQHICNVPRNLKPIHATGVFASS